MIGVASGESVGRAAGTRSGVASGDAGSVNAGVPGTEEGVDCGICVGAGEADVVAVGAGVGDAYKLNMSRGLV